MATPPHARPPTAFDNPRTWLRVIELGRDVVSCDAAAEAKDLPLWRELKSLVLETGRRHAQGEHCLVVAHIRGDHRLSLRTVKHVLQVSEARLASPAMLQSLGVAPGTVHPFHPSLWVLEHLVDPEVLRLEWVTTNAGRLDAYVVFDPAILLRATTITINDLERS